MEPVRDQLYEAIPIGLPAIVATTQIAARAVYVLGYSLIEATGAAVAQVDIVGGPDGAGDTLAVVQLGNGLSTHQTFPARGLYSADGLTVKVNAGSVRGALWVVYA